jgi:hypothetical protein
VKAVLEIPRGLIAACAVASAVLFAFAASAYPGGNHFDHHTPGHDFWRNALCDVARSTAVGGAPNPVGAGFARLAMSTMAFAIGLLLWSLPRHFPRRPMLRHVVRVFAAITVPCALAVVFLPTDRFSDVHGMVVVLAGVLGTGGATIAVAASLREARRPSALLGAFTLVASFVALGIYVVELVAGGPPRLAVPVFEHIAALLLLAWMLAFEAESRV